MANGPETPRSTFDVPSYLRRRPIPQVEGQGIGRLAEYDKPLDWDAVEADLNAPAVPESVHRENLPPFSDLRLAEDIDLVRVEPQEAYFAVSGVSDFLPVLDEFGNPSVPEPFEEIDSVSTGRTGIATPIVKESRRRRLDARSYRSHDILPDGARIVLGKSERPKKRPDSHTKRAVQLGIEVDKTGLNREEREKPKRPVINEREHIEEHLAYEDLQPRKSRKKEGQLPRAVRRWRVWFRNQTGI